MMVTTRRQTRCLRRCDGHHVCSGKRESSLNSIRGPMRSSILKVLCVSALVLGVSSYAEALTISPATAPCGTPACLLEPPVGYGGTGDTALRHYVEATYGVEMLYAGGTNPPGAELGPYRPS